MGPTKTAAVAAAALLTPLSFMLTCARSARNTTERKLASTSYPDYGISDAWSSLLWTRFPKEVFPLYLTPYIEAGKIAEAQNRSRVRGLLHDDVESYSGYITVDKRYHSNMFVWFFPAEKPAHAPVLLWLNGGPGRTSLVGALLENGPLLFTQPLASVFRVIPVSLDTDKTARMVLTSGTVKRREVAWTKLFSMIYVDNPVGTGYSFILDNAGLSRSMDDVARNLYSVLTQFFKMFPEYAKNDFYVGGQSYAGKYVPSLGCYIDKQNHGQHPPEVYINFKGIYLGAGYCSPEKMMPAFADFLFNMGFISDYKRRELRRKFIRLIKNGLSGKRLLSPSEYLGHFFGEPTFASKLDTADHVLGAKATVSDEVELIPEWMDEARTRIALHVGYAVKDLRQFAIASSAARDALRHEFLQDTVYENAFLMDNYKVLHYSGNLDVIVNVPMTEAFLASVPWSGQAEYISSNSLPWVLEGEIAGYFIQIGNFTRVIVKNSGHMVPSDQPKWALKMMERFIFDKPFETHNYD